jgi:hypothetical protein
MAVTQVPRGAYVLLNPKRAEVLQQLGWTPPQFFHDASMPAWTVTWESAGARLYRVGG